MNVKRCNTIKVLTSLVFRKKLRGNTLLCRFSGWCLLNIFVVKVAWSGLHTIDVVRDILHGTSVILGLIIVRVHSLKR